MTRRLLAAAPLALAAALLAGCSSEYGEAGAVDSTTSTSPATPATGADLVSLTYSVNGLHCDGCVQGVTSTVSALPGVAECQVSLEEGRMVVRVDEPATGDAVAAAVRAMNYTVAPLPAGDAGAADDADDADGAVSGD